jgi:hypothetical protein
LLLHGDGTNGSTAIRDELGHTAGVHGETRISTNTSRFGGSSLYFDGSGDYLEFAAGPDWAFGTNDFTVDLWANFSSGPGTVNLIGPHTTGLYTEWSLVYEQGALKFFINGTPVASYAWVPPVGQWHHLAATRAAGTLRLFVDGSLVRAVANSADISNNRTLTVGAASNAGLFFHGYLDEVRVLKSRAAWMADFTPPDAPYAY